MNRKLIGRRIKRNEDPRLLTGQALFVDDVALPGMLHAAFLRSDYAHARFKGIDVSRALERPGVAAVFTAEDMGDDWAPGPPLVIPPPTVEGVTFHTRTQVPLVKHKVRHMGEPLAVVIAESRYIAEDALDDIVVDLKPLPAVVDLEQGLEPDSALVHDDLDTNLAAHLVQDKGDYESIREEAALVVARRFDLDRGAAGAMENRGIVASWDKKQQQLTIWDTTQAPIPIRNGLAKMFGLSENQVRVIAPFVGGGFGPKIMMFYPEEVVLTWATLKLCQPIKWIEDRRENFFATTQERNQVHFAEMALDRQGKILGLRDDFLHDTGAYDPYGLTIPINTQCHVLGPYKIDNYTSELKVVFTNKIHTTPVRGAGRQHAVFVVERLLDIAARELGIDRAEIRQRNFLTPDMFPYDNVIIDQAFAPFILDSGDYRPAMELAQTMISYKEFIEEEQPRLKAEGKYVGLGIVPFIETTGVGPYEGARVTIESSGDVRVATGVGTQGQGHFTSFAQIVAEHLGVDIGKVHMVTGDTAQFHWGTGTFASRGTVVVGTAMSAAASAVRGKVLKLASEVLEVPEEKLEIEDGVVRVADCPRESISFAELAQRANPLRGAVQPGTEPGLEATSYFGPNRGATSFGVHAIVVEVDPETSMVDIKKYIVVEDCGTVLNPLLLEGQVHGGVAHGIGNAFYEKLHFDENGRLLNPSLTDYLIPSSSEVPPIEVAHRETPSPLNPLGTKGAGESGTIPVPAVFAQAVEDALSEYQLEITETPLSPLRLYELLHGRKEGA